MAKTTQPPAGAERAYCMFCLTPISKVFKNAMDDNTDGCAKMLKAVGARRRTTSSPPEAAPQALHAEGLPAHDALLDARAAPAVAGARAEVPRRRAVHRPDRRQAHGDPQLRPRRPADDVHLEAHPDARQGRFYAFGRSSRAR